MNQAEFENTLSDVEIRLDRLRGLYEQWFQGVERLEPTVPRKEVERRIALLAREKPRNTAMRFRFQTLLQKYTTYQTYWRRVSRQIEEGTYRRDVLKARARIAADREQIARERERMRSGSFDIDIDVELEAGEPEVEQETPTSHQPSAPKGGQPRREQSTPPAPIVRANAAAEPPRQTDGSIARSMPRGFALPKVPNAAAPARLAIPAPPKPRADGAARPHGPHPPVPPPPAASAPRAVNAHAPTPAVPAQRLADSDLRRVYERYIDARRRNNERTDNVPFETVALNIRKMLPHLEQKHAGKRIDFEVVVKDGKVGLKPVPR
jgi:hypothetical protein